MKSLAVAALSVVSLALAGCGGSGDRPELGTVKGKVLMDDKPLAGAIIVFQPEKGRASTGTTDGDGDYVLEYRHEVPGAKIGPHTVRFEWPLGEAGQPIPARYTTKSELKKEVKEGENTIDFDLKSEPADKGAPPPKAVD